MKISSRLHVVGGSGKMLSGSTHSCGSAVNCASSAAASACPRAHAGTFFCARRPFRRPPPPSSSSSSLLKPSLSSSHSSSLCVWVGGDRVQSVSQ